MHRTLLLTLIVISSTALANEPANRKHLQTERRDAALESITARLDSNSSSNMLAVLGDAQLRAGKYDEAVNTFERVITADPESEPHLWQYGIALFFAQRYADGKQLFEKHRIVNPHDVENAAWHFLCVAKASDVEQARKILLPAPDDRRAPMKEILERLPGGSDQAIVDRMNQLHDVNASFYGNLYIGLIADAEGDKDTAKRYIRLAAETPLSHYMADVARVYDQWLEDK
ncbi:lipoprotein NlpI [Rubripirellula amarantea]|uniref:Lipoprotein NlpI n=1 Tax=Rubripirellula amarantea TaxID=2527999 RepID=A0A5C5WTK5_9BACT|nr:tetratricopeptide repeat protein [Rubripirellula amarantea]TWT53481.1 lipoprotein NlpI [Rubripirellula amarantea]